MILTNSVAFVSTKKENTIGVHMISTYRYRKLMPNQFTYTEYMGASFEINEDVG